MHAPTLGYAGLCRDEASLFGLGLTDIAERRMRDCLGVMHHGHIGAIERLILRQLLLDYLAPFAETHQNVLFHREISFKEVRHWWRFNAQDCFWDRGDQLLCCRDRRGVLAKEHRDIDREMEVVDDVDQ